MLVMLELTCCYVFSCCLSKLILSMYLYPVTSSGYCYQLQRLLIPLIGVKHDSWVKYFLYRYVVREVNAL